MTSDIPDGVEITPALNGSFVYSKASYPVRYGKYGEIKTKDYIWQFNLKGEVKFLKGRKDTWPDPTEWLKRTAANDWIYYSTGGYSGTLEYSGEYYIPCARYRTNSIIVNDPFGNREVRNAVDSYRKLYDFLSGLDSDAIEPDEALFIKKILENTPESLEKKRSVLKSISGDRITVLPPDSRHADYDVIPVIIADGCLYKCGFCSVRSSKKFGLRTESDIREQIRRLRQFYGPDIVNYNSLFLGQHDALNAGIDLIEKTAIFAFKELDTGNSVMEGANLFLFGSVDSLLDAGYDFFKRLSNLSCMIYINIGLESADEETLDYISKNISPDKVERAFEKILDINREYTNIELTSNFLYSDRLPENHYPSIIKLIDKYTVKSGNKGTVYFSPMFNMDETEARYIKRRFFALKREIRLPAYLYLIQRL